MTLKRCFLIFSPLLTVLIILAGIGIGSVFISPGQTAAILLHKLAGKDLPESIPGTFAGIVWSLRLPRVLLAWITGAALSVSGAVMQSVLKNPLASSFTLGVSSGASLGAGLVLFFGSAVPFLAFLPAEIVSSVPVPLAGFLFSMLAIAVVMGFSGAVDPRFSNTTVILSGMVFSLFINAVLTLLSALSRQEMSRLLFWQMGSFALKGWSPVVLLFPVVTAGILAVFYFRREMDILSFSDDDAIAIGVPAGKIKKILIILASLLTGFTISFVGVIGFLDLAVPHVVRRIFGPGHRTLIPFSALFGGFFMVLADILARVIIPSLELPVGAITAVLGTPLFAWIYISSRKRYA
ncbi:iron ABC transporter permease [Brucepastera parasyntrophica]|uniref:FecCD family ABC transporter permease n=1 Tax=Brucepastera parasyntrophica TaxID=2880008 RepID=UPI00210EFFBC|nr:iron ABC transporter permease [Brucepastera parasyntrophica]ULQ58493.1 iron ABC transporter permease [Brucepastera parasyntrophica]